MKKILFVIGLVLAVVGCDKNDLADRTLELCQYIPDHRLNPEAEKAMTPECVRALSEAFEAPVADFCEIGDNEWLFYFVTGNGGGEPVYSVKSISRTGKTTAQAIILVRLMWEDGSFAEGADKEYELLLKCVKGQWLLDDFDHKKAECRSYVQQVREKYVSGYYVKYLESSDYTKEYVPEFQNQLEAFYDKYGK